MEVWYLLFVLNFTSDVPMTRSSLKLNVQYKPHAHQNDKDSLHYGKNSRANWETVNLSNRNPHAVKSRSCAQHIIYRYNLFFQLKAIYSNPKKHLMNSFHRILGVCFWISSWLIMLISNVWSMFWGCRICIFSYLHF